MDNITYMPNPDDLGACYSQIVAEEIEKRRNIFKDIADRVIEHSDEIKKIFEEGETDHE